MSIKIALCDDHQFIMTQVQTLIQAHPQSALFEVRCFLTTKALLSQSVVYDLLITDIEKAPGDINGFELASQINEHTKIIIFSYHNTGYICYKMYDYYFELFESIEKKAQGQISQALDNYLAWRENPQMYSPLVPKRTPSPRPSITLRTHKKTETTLYYDDILYLTQPFFSLIPQVIITTLDGEYKVASNFGVLSQIGQQSQFYPSNHSQHLVNLNYCALNLRTKSLIMTLNGEPIKTFKPSKAECRSLCYYFVDHYI